MKIIALVLTSCLLVSAASAQGFTLQRRSTYKADPGARNPFQPIGWKKSATPTAPGAPAPAPVVLIKPEQFSVTSILMGDPSLAVVNGRELAEGEVVELEIGGRPLPIRVVAIHDGSVVLQHGDTSVTAPLKPR
jgi:hypothetical protein